MVEWSDGRARRPAAADFDFITAVRVLRAGKEYGIILDEMENDNSIIAIEDFAPAFAARNIPVALSTDINYLPYVGVLMTSILDHNKTDNFDFIILHQVITQDIQKDFIERFSESGRVSIRFIDVGEIVKTASIPEVPKDRRLTIAALFRMFLPYLLVRYSKILYLDIDIIVNCDIARFYNIDIGDNYLGGVVDGGEAGFVAGFPAYKNALEEEGYTEFSGYINTGALLMNLEALRNDKPMEEFIRLGIKFNRFTCDQDALNIICKGKIMYLEEDFNRLLHVNTEWKKEAEKANVPPQAIYHYCSTYKPWTNTDMSFAPLWWQYAVKTKIGTEALLSLANEKQKSANFANLNRWLTKEKERLSIQAKQQEQENDILCTKSKKQAKEIAELKASFAYRVGMFVTWPARKMNKAMKKLLRQH